ncbi:MAG: hypothetical protein IJO82_06900 [Clostridia bacterium]|nr:hypothetical protein [Clostridia bacterium]
MQKNGQTGGLLEQKEKIPCKKDRLSCRNWRCAGGLFGEMEKGTLRKGIEGNELWRKL